MKRWIHASSDVTNTYLDELFKNLDWDDVEYADRLVDRTIKKELGVDRVFDQAKYINMLDESVKTDLMNLLSDPEAVHQRRMKGKRGAKKTAQSSKPCELYVKYEDYPDGNVKEATFEGDSRLDAIKKLVDALLLYIDVDQIESDEMSFEDVINEIERQNGDGCDYIIQLVDRTNGQTLMDYYYEEAEDL